MINILVLSRSVSTTDALAALLSTGRDVALVGSATTPEEAIERSHDVSPSLIIVDTALGQSASVQAVALLAERTEAVLVVLTTADRESRETAAVCLRVGAADVVEMPYPLAGPDATRLSKERLAELGEGFLDKLRAGVEHHRLKDQSPLPEPGQARLVLLAEDNATERFVLEHTLTRAGYRVESTTDGASALQAARTLGPELIILDYWLPEMDGLAVLQAIRSEAIPAVVIMMSGHGSEQVAAAALHERADHYLIKPVVPWQLLSLVESSLEQLDIQHQLERTRAVHASVVDHLPVGVFVLDANHVVVEWNRTMERITGIARDEVLGNDSSNECPFWAQLRYGGILGELAPGSSQSVDEMETADRDGNRIVLSLRISHLKQDNMTVGVIRDVTRQVDLRTQLLRAERERAQSRMVVTASHEINGPLTVILGNLHFLQEELEGTLSQRARQDMQIIEDAVARIKEVMQQLSTIPDPPTAPYLGDVEMYDLNARTDSQ